ncbi:hypothetical protein ARMGADRAFT_300049 [Armillaria gallica]|uniref:Uncharacterized protein n=1 Tax=Armillaria gallica TaxID=47427 RepID=A0A2H3D5P3_ARMGA|nr:hypothetical protein ARMGADRAFT_300049 [Armillaria gallica]
MAAVYCKGKEHQAWYNVVSNSYTPLSRARQPRSIPRLPPPPLGVLYPSYRIRTNQKLPLAHFPSNPFFLAYRSLHRRTSQPPGTLAHPRRV